MRLFHELVSLDGICAQLKIGAYITGDPLVESDRFSLSTRTINPKAPVVFCVKFKIGGGVVVVVVVVIWPHKMSFKVLNRAKPNAVAS